MVWIQGRGKQNAATRSLKATAKYGRRGAYENFVKQSKK
jgi:hypothetical protein